MFESLLEKILNKFLGDFIEGFDASNLHIGIWSGEVTITNVALKADVVKMLELPIGIKFSHIGKLRLQVQPVYIVRYHGNHWPVPPLKCTSAICTLLYQLNTQMIGCFRTLLASRRS